MGNKADVSSNDLLRLWADDESTRVVLLYLECFGDPVRFARVARAVSRRKPDRRPEGRKDRSGPAQRPRPHGGPRQRPRHGRRAVHPHRCDPRPDARGAGRRRAAARPPAGAGGSPRRSRRQRRRSARPRRRRRRRGGSTSRCCRPRCRTRSPGPCQRPRPRPIRSTWAPTSRPTSWRPSCRSIGRSGEVDACMVVFVDVGEQRRLDEVASLALRHRRRRHDAGAVTDRCPATARRGSLPAFPTPERAVGRRCPRRPASPWLASIADETVDADAADTSLRRHRRSSTPDAWPGATRADAPTSHGWMRRRRSSCSTPPACRWRHRHRSGRRQPRAARRHDPRPRVRPGRRRGRRRHRRRAARRPGRTGRAGRRGGGATGHREPAPGAVAARLPRSPGAAGGHASSRWSSASPCSPPACRRSSSSTSTR